MEQNQFQIEYGDFEEKFFENCHTNLQVYSFQG